VLVKNEELAAIGVRSGIGHRDEAAAVPAAIQRRVLIDLVLEGSAPRAFTAGAIAGGVAPLDHETLDDAVERQAVVLAVLGEQPEILDGLRGVCREELDLDWALVGLDGAVHASRALGP